MEPLKAEIEALQAVMFTPVEQFVTDKERAERGDEAAEKLAHKRMFASAIKAVDEARGARTLYNVILRHGRGTSTFYTGFGPYPTTGQAEKAVEKLGHVFEYTAYAVVPTRNAEGLEQMVKELDAEPEGRAMFAIVKEDARLTKLGWDGKQKSRKKYEAMA
ncbi:MAG: hypothetical protein ACXVGN_00205 [Mycobacteriaceae bacterium]